MEFNVKVKEDPKLTSLTEIDLHSLAEIRDTKDTFLTIYLELREGIATNPL